MVFFRKIQEKEEPQREKIAYTLSEEEIQNLPISIQELARRTKIVYADIPHAYAMVSEKKPVLKIPKHRLRIITDEKWLIYRNKQTTFHELGHSMASSKRMSIEKIGEWTEICKKEPQNVVALRGKDWDEDFAQSFMLYNLHPAELKEEQPERFRFIQTLK